MNKSITNLDRFLIFDETSNSSFKSLQNNQIKSYTDFKKTSNFQSIYFLSHKKKQNQERNICIIAQEDSNQNLERETRYNQVETIMLNESNLSNSNILNQAFTESQFLENNAFFPPNLPMTKCEMKFIKKKVIKRSGSSCIVCLDKYQENQIIRILPCNHIFHYKCLKPWLKTSSFCPLCRTNIKEKIWEKFENQLSTVLKKQLSTKKYFPIICNKKSCNRGGK